jgi:predicted flap endonuclease-1-like 5' DNA nuclease
MNLTILLALPTKTEATLTIIVMLTGAAIIGFITAWLIIKAKEAHRQKVLDDDNKDLRSQLLHAHADNTLLKKTEEEKRRGLLSRHGAKVNAEGQLVISRRKKRLDYQSFGTATIEERDDLKMISGIGPFIEEKLHEVKIFTFRQISRFTLKDIETIDEVIEFFHGRITRDEWVAQANELVQAKDKRLEMLGRIRGRRSSIVYDRIGVATKEEADDLTDISGVGGWINEKLNALDIHTFRQVSNFTKEDEHDVTEAIEYFHGRIERDEWIPQAKEMVRLNGKKKDLLKRISDRKQHIEFDRLGKAQKHEAHNLTLINGIGLWIEERLNALGIYTIVQISNLTPVDVRTITEIVEIPVGRIEKDEWIAQAKELLNRPVVHYDL